MKQCAKCKQMKPRRQFHKCIARHDGLQAICAECSTIVRRKYVNNQPKPKPGDYPITYRDIMSLEAHLVKYPAEMLRGLAGE